MKNLFEEYLVPFYKKELSLEAFVSHVQNDSDLANLLDQDKFLIKQLKSLALGKYIAKPSQYIILISTKNEINADVAIGVQIRDFLSQDQYCDYLSNEDKKDIILSHITNLNEFYNADVFFESYVKKTIIEPLLTQNLTLSKQIKQAEKEVYKHFTAEKKLPKWVQNCEWQFDENGQPMIFVDQQRDGKNSSTIFTFKTKFGDTLLKVNQHD